MNEKLTIEELGAILVQEYALPKGDVALFLKEFFQLIAETLTKDPVVKIKGLGTFKLVELKDRESVNIQDGERFVIKGSHKISFTPETALRDLINKPFAHFETEILNDAILELDSEVTDNQSTPSDSIDHLIEEEDVAFELEEKEELASSEPSPLEPQLIVVLEKEEEVISETEQTPLSTEIEQLNQPDESENSAEEELIADEIVHIEPLFTIEIPTEEELYQTEFEAIEEQNQTEAKPVEEQNQLASFDPKTLNMFDQPTITNDSDESEVAVEEPKKRSKLLAYSWILPLFILLGAAVFFFWEELSTLNFEKELVRSTYKKETPTAESSLPKDTSIALTQKKPIEETKKETPPLDSNASSGNSEKGAVKNQKLDDKNTTNYQITGTLDYHVISTGDRLSIIALKYYGSKKFYPFIVKANPVLITDQNNIPIGTIIKIPALSEKATSN